MNMEEALEIIDGACEILNTSDQLIVTRGMIGNDNPDDALSIGKLYLWGLYFGLSGAKRLIDGEDMGNTPLEFVTHMATAYAIALSDVGAAQFLPYEAVMSQYEDSKDAPAAGDDAL